MSSNTPNLNLVKLSGTDNFSNANGLAGNWDKVDQFAGKSKATTLASGTNFNDLLGQNTGETTLYNGSNLSQMTNTPSEVASQAWPFLLRVYRVGAGSSGYYTQQILHVYSTTGSKFNTFVRSQSYIESGTNWLDWQKLALTDALSTVDVLSTIATTFSAISTSDARIVYTKQGIFHSLQFKFKCSSAITTGSATLPTSVTGSLIEVECALASLDGNGGMAQLNGRTLYIRCGESSTNFLFGQLNWVA